MLKALRSRGFALATLTAFMVAQPVVACTALCLLEKHHAGAHAMPGTHSGSTTLGNAACHPVTGAVQRGPVQVLSPIEPAHAPVIAMVPARSVEPLRLLPIPPRLIAHSIEPPPPRFV